MARRCFNAWSPSAGRIDLCRLLGLDTVQARAGGETGSLQRPRTESILACEFFKEIAVSGLSA